MPLSNPKFIQRHPALITDEYWFEIDEYQCAGGRQFLLAHIRIHKFTPSVLKRIDHEWSVFRQCVKAPLFAIAETDDSKWERFVSRLGFRHIGEVTCNNGELRRLFLSKGSNVGFSEDNSKHAAELANVPLGSAG